MVKYQIQYKPINPITNDCVTNTTLSPWTGATAISGANNPNYAMLLMFIRTSQTGTLSVTDFKRVENETWAVYAVKDSIKEAMVVAKPLIRQYGVDNVQICKVISSDLNIIFGDD